MSFIATTLNHFRAVNTWIEANGAEARVDVRDFHMEVKARNRYFRLRPRFLASLGGRLAHVEMLTPDVTGMIGWLPYRTPLRWELGGDKLAFKRFLRDKDVRTPAFWERPAQSSADFILKRPQGSFGYELHGPFRPGSALGTDLSPQSPGGEFFAEAFILGRNLKVWFWGADPFCAHLHDYPVVEGDGRTRLRALVQDKLAEGGRGLDDSADMAVVRQALAYQHVTLDDVLPQDRQVWLDYRYGRRFLPPGGTAGNDNDWPQMAPAARQACESLGELLGAELMRLFTAPVLYSVDGVVDANGDVWWLEMNSNPILPPDGYPLILDTLFGTRQLA